MKCESMLTPRDYAAHAAFARFDREYGDGRALRSAFVDRGFEKQIHTNEIGHAALTKSRTTVRILSPVGPAAIQIGFQVIALHTPTVTNVEIAVLPTLAKNEGSVRLGTLHA